MPKRGHKKQSGGADSGWSYVMSKVGDGWTQFQNSLTLQPGQNLGTSQSNDIEPIGKPNFQNNQGMPTSKELALIQSAGKRRKKRSGGSWVAMANQAAAPVALLAMQQNYGKKNRTKKNRSGGSWMAMANQAAAPAALLAMQQTYGKKKRSGGNLAALANQAAAPVALLAMQQTYGKKRSRNSRGTKKNRRSRRR